MIKTLALAILAYCLVAFIAFGDILSPLLWSGRLGAPLWRVIALASALLSAVVFLVPPLSAFPTSLKLTLFVALATIVSLVSIGFYADCVRREHVTAFQGDASVDHSFFESMRKSPREYQFYLHAAALKNCVPYGWSYRTMDFYVIPAEAAVNVLPADWIKRCSIHVGLHNAADAQTG